MKEINIAIIGYGYWGKNLVRNFYGTPNCKIALVVDSDQQKLNALVQSYPSIPTSTQIDDIYLHPDIEAVVIATPVFSHFSLAVQALENNKHVLVEKPMTASSKEAKELIELATKKQRILMPDHTFLYTGAVQKMKQLVDNGEIGKIKYIDSIRINLGLFQPDVNVLWDLAPHDISICNYLMEEEPYSIQATGISHTKNGIENIAYLTVNYASDKIAHFNCSWSSPVKIRQMLIGGDRKMILYNDMEPTEKLKVYDTGYEIKSEEDKTRIMVDYRIGDIFVPKLNTIEALAAMAKDFIESIDKNTLPISNAALGFSVVRILEAAEQSIKEKGKEVLL